MKNKLVITNSNVTGNTTSNTTLADACALWENKAIALNLSPVTVLNTRDQFKVITKILPAETLIDDITEDVYYEFVAKCRQLGYSEETIFLINGSLRKLINLCYKRRLLNENILDYCDNIKTVKKDDYRVISKEKYDRLDEYFSAPQSDPRCFSNNFPQYRFLIALLYYTGARIGEILALTWDDFIPYLYSCKSGHIPGIRVNINKSYVPRLRITKVPKNFKCRLIPLASHPLSIYRDMKSEHLTQGGSTSDRIFSLTYSPLDKALKRACRELNLPAYHFHEFRHTYISYLIAKNIPLTVIEKMSGDTQNTILTRYSHCFENGETLVMEAMENM